MKITDMFLAVFVAALWGSNVAVIKVALADLPPLFMLAVRFLLAAIFLLPFLRSPGRYFSGIFAYAATICFFHFAPLFIGLTEVDAATAVILIQLQVPFAVLLALIWLDERLTLRKTLGILVAFGGVVIIAGRPELTGGMEFLTLIVAAALGWAIANFQMKKLHKVHPMMINAWLCVLAVPMMGISSLVFEKNQLARLADIGTVGIAALLYTVATFIAGYGLWYLLLGRNPINHVVPFTLLAPIFGVAAGVVILEEPLTVQVIAGALVTITGIAMIILRRDQRKDLSRETS